MRHQRVMDALLNAEEQLRQDDPSARQEFEDDMNWLNKVEEITNRAAGYLNREFPQVPVSTWLAALNSPEKVQFTSDKKMKRFEAAYNWMQEQISKI